MAPAAAVTTTVLALALATAVAGLTSADYGPTFSGDGTYYGESEGGNCALRPPRPGMYAGMVPVAINDAQYGNSDACGACLEVTGSGEGSGADPITGTFQAYVSDRCPECAEGALDLAKSGDGRWAISWKFVPCPGEGIAFQFEGSNDFYWKLQPRGMSSPAASVTVAGITAERTQDNHFVAATGPPGFQAPVTVVVTTVLGDAITSQLSSNTGVVSG